MSKATTVAHFNSHGPGTVSFSQVCESAPQKVERLRREIAGPEAELKRQREGVYMHFTSGNIVILHNQIARRETEIRQLEGAK